jgi:CO/xanthine dehydrogenase FAD-binding subunit
MKPVLLPRSLEELWQCLEDAPNALLYAGGTDVLVKVRKGLESVPGYICLERIEELRAVVDLGESIRIGATATYAQLLDNPLVGEHLGVLHQAIRNLGSPLIRAMGTIGGNLGTASPAGDTLPPLFVLQAEVELASRQATRTMPIRDFIRGPGLTALQQGEIVKAVCVRKPRGRTIHHFEKVGHRNALACSLASIAALLWISDAGIVEQAVLAWGSVGPGIVVVPAAEQILAGRRLTRDALETAAVTVRATVAPIDDVRASADYRRMVAGNLLLRLSERLPAASCQLQ